MAKQKHMTLDMRKAIQTGLNSGARRTSIARAIGKDPSTVFREIAKHRYIDNRYKKRGHLPLKRFDCIHREECGKKNVCDTSCNDYVPEPCKRRDKTVGACNGCESFRTCKRQRWLYDAERADNEYHYTLRDSREGLNITTREAERIGSIIKPLIGQGQSLYAIVQNHPEIGLSEKTLYNYITAGVFAKNGLIDMDLRLKTSRKHPRQKIRTKPRENRTYLKGRTYNDFLVYMEQHPDAAVVEMDTVYNDGTGGPFIQTFEFVETDIMVAVLHREKTASAMVDGVCRLRENLKDSFSNMVQVLLTDRGTEFTAAEEFEKLGVHIFYCDPQASCQKPHVENNHILLRWILPKKKNLYEMGLRSQEDLDLIFSNINSYRRKALKGKSAIELLKFYYGDDILYKFRLKEIEPDKIVLDPSLIRK